MPDTWRNDTAVMTMKTPLPALVACCTALLLVAASPARSQEPAPPAAAPPLSLPEAVQRAVDYLPAYKAALFTVQSGEALFKASLGPYVPRVDTSAAYRRFYTSLGDFDTRSFELSLSYLLFNGGERRANRNIASINLEDDRLSARDTLIELRSSVKTAFYTSLAQQESVLQRRVQLEDARKDLEIAEGRYKFGVARLSDTLQAGVRLEQARFNLIQAEGNLVQAYADLNSLIGMPLDSRYELVGSLDHDMKLPERSFFAASALAKPQIQQAENAVRRAEQNQALAGSAFWPSVTADAAYQRTSGGQFRFGSAPEEKFVGLTATWNLFELGKFYRYRSARFDRSAASEQASEVKRRLLLDVNNAYEDVLVASGQLDVARRQLKQAQQNYEQAFGEYKVGKADILALVQAESFLAEARDQLIASRLNLILSLTQLERLAGLPMAQAQSGAAQP